MVLVSMREGEEVVGYMVAGEAGEGELSLEPEWSEGGPALWLGEEEGVAQPGPRWAGRRYGADLQRESQVRSHRSEVTSLTCMNCSGE